MHWVQGDYVKEGVLVASQINMKGKMEDPITHREDPIS